MNDEERRTIQRMLRAEGAGVWTKVASQLDAKRNQVDFWVLVESKAALAPAARRLLDRLQEPADRFPDTEFHAGIIEIRGNTQIHWENFDDEEIRENSLRPSLGQNFGESDYKGASVFDYFEP